MQTALQAIDEGCHKAIQHKDKAKKEILCVEDGQAGTKSDELLANDEGNKLKAHGRKLSDAETCKFIAKELFDTEVSYVASLHDLLQCFLLPIQEIMWTSKRGWGQSTEPFRKLLLTVEQIHRDHSSYVNAMKNKSVQDVFKVAPYLSTALFTALLHCRCASRLWLC